MTQISYLPDKILPELSTLISTYSKIDRVNPSSWLCWSNSLKDIDKNHLAVCHARLPGVRAAIFDNLITAISKSDKISLKYQQMLISGPFKDFSHLITLDHIDSNYFVYCSNLDKWPANVLYNYCIATRIPIEHYFLLDKWEQFSEEGFNPVLAFLLSYLRCSNIFYNHMWFDISSDWSNIIKGNMNRLSPDFKSEPTAARPCNVIWGQSLSNRQFSRMSNEEIAEYLKFPLEVKEQHA